MTRIDEFRRAKHEILDRLPETLPEEVTRNELLMGLITGLIAPDPDQRFPDAEAADLVELGAASFHRQLVMGDLASEYDNEIRVWLEELEDDDDPDDDSPVGYKTASRSAAGTTRRRPDAQSTAASLA